MVGWGCITRKQASSEKFLIFSKWKLKNLAPWNVLFFLVGNFKVLVFSLTSFGNSWGKPCTRFVVDIKFPFTCGEPSVFTFASTKILQSFKTLWKYCMSFFFFNFLHFQLWIRFLEKALNLLKNKVETFLISSFELNQISDIQKTFKFGTLTQLGRFGKSFELMENVKKIELWKKISSKEIEDKWKFGKIAHEQKTLISSFAYFLTAIAKVLFLQGRLGTMLCLYPNLRFFLHFLIFQES